MRDLRHLQDCRCEEVDKMGESTEVKNITIQMSEEEIQNLLNLIKRFNRGVSAGEIEDVITVGNGKEERKDDAPYLTSREVAALFNTPHSQVFKKISAWICDEATEEERAEFVIDTFSIPQGQQYSMYRMTEKACNLYIEKIQKQTTRNYKSVCAGIEKMKREMVIRFGEASTLRGNGGKFLLEGSPREEYENICRMFNDFITGPGLFGREIPELTASYEKLYGAMKEAGGGIKNMQKIESAMMDVAIDAEMQGFVYGFRLFDAMLTKSLAA